jgi:putative ABC transport system permease protein
MTVLSPTSERFLAAEPRSRRRGMTLLEAFRIAYHGLVANKLRSMLTMLGIIIGVGAVVVMVAMGQGTAKATTDSINRLGTNRLHIRPEDQRSRGISQGVGSGENLTLEDAQALSRKARYVSKVVPEYRSGNIRLKYGNKNHLTDVHGATPDYFEVRSMIIERGRSFTEAELQQKARVAVIGDTVRENLFGEASGIRKSIRINGQPFLVVGETKKVGGVPFGNRDDQVTIPLTTSMKRLFRAKNIRAISAQAVSLDKMDEAETEIREILRKRHKRAPDEPDDIRVFNQADLIESANQQSTFLTLLLSGIALVSLVVGGIGIMNIMLVSVTERTREIGIRKALGAKRKDILYQFLIESVTMSLAGGIIGIGLGIGLASWFSRPPSEGGAGIPMLITLPPLLISFGFSALVGIFFGIYPAMKASSLNPIEALRYE